MRQINDPNQFVVVFKTLNGLVRQLDEYRSNAKNIEHLFSHKLNDQRLKLRAYCEKVMFEIMASRAGTASVNGTTATTATTANVVAAVKKIEELLWQKIFYETIATGKKMKTQLTASESFLLNSHIHSAIGYYHHLLMKLLNYYRREVDLDDAVDETETETEAEAAGERSGRCHRYEEIVVRDWQEPKLDFMFEQQLDIDVDENGTADVTAATATKSSTTLALKMLVRYLIYRALLCLGDLNRYKLAFTIGASSWATETNRKIAIDFYRKAADCCPDYGMPFNQIASLTDADADASLGSSLGSVYFYLRSLNCRIQFNGSEGNLMALYDKKQQVDDGNETVRFLDRFLLWILGLFFERNEQKVAAVAAESASIKIATNDSMLKTNEKKLLTTQQPTLEELLKDFDCCLEEGRERSELSVVVVDCLTDDILTKVIAIAEFVAVKLLLANRSKIVVERIEQFLLAVWTKLVKRTLQNSSFAYCPSTSGGSSNGEGSSGANSANNTNSSSSTSNTSSPLNGCCRIEQQTWLKSIKMLSDWFLSRSTLRDENLRGPEQFSLAKKTSFEFVKNLFRFFNAIRTQSVVSGVNIMDVETAVATAAANETDYSDEKWITGAVRVLDEENIDDYPVSEDFLLKNTLVFERYRDRYVAIRWFYYDEYGNGQDPVSFSARFDHHLRLLKLLALGKLFAERVFQQSFRYDCDSNRFVSVRNQVKENVVKTTSDQQLMESMGQLWIEAEIKELEHQIETSRYSSPILIVESNAFVNHFSIVKYLVSTRRYVLIVPNAVLGVLDEQKLQSTRVREMIRWLEKQLCDGNRFIRAQRAHEKLALPLIRCPRQQRRGKSYRHYANAMSIAECCHYFVSQKDSSSLMVTLLYDYGMQNCCSTSTKNDLIALAKSIDVRSELITFFYESLRNIKQRKF